MRFFSLSIVFMSVIIGGSAFSDELQWFKTGPEKQPRYFLKGSTVPLCGLFGRVTALAVKSDGKQKLSSSEREMGIESCLEAKDDIDEVPPKRFIIQKFEKGNLEIRQAAVEEAEEGGKAKEGKVYSVPGSQVVTLWAVRYQQGDLMIDGPGLCNVMNDWRGPKLRDRFKRYLPSLKSVPFQATGEGEIVRYHVFEYHLGCGT